MNVVKRNGTMEEVSFDKIYKRIKYLSSKPYKLNYINPHTVAQHVIQGLYDGVRTTEIDTRTSIVCANLSIQNYEYGVLAGRVCINNHQKNTLTSFKDKVDRLYLRKDDNGDPCPIVSSSFYKFVKRNQKSIEQYIDYSRDYMIDFFGFKTLEKSYLLRITDGDNVEIIERPQDLFMRVAIFIHMGTKKTPNTMNDIFETYDLLSNKYFTHATPTLFNSGLTRPSLASCFLLGSEDSLEGIFKTLTDCAHISKWSGGIGFHISNWRGSNSLIRGTGGNSSGIVPFLKIFEKTSVAVNQGGRRPGSFAPYLEMHHPDIKSFLDLSKKNIAEEFKANKLYLALWISDLFMTRVKNDEDWSAFCPDKCPGLSDCYGEEYEKLYKQYETEGKASWTCKARDIWLKIFESQKESGFPYMVYKDAVNRNSNQKNVGVIKSSNLCSEIVEYSSSTEYAVCTLTSICLPRFVEDTYTEEELKQPENERRELNHEFPQNPVFNYEKFRKVVEVNVRNLNKVIDINYYPVPETKRSNLRHRPIGIGVQGLADVFFKFNITFDSKEAAQLNKYIFETLYYSALSASSKLCREVWNNAKQECIDKKKVIVSTKPSVNDNSKVSYTKTEYKDPSEIPTDIGAYSSFSGSPISKGIFHWEMMGLTEDDLITDYDWNTLRSHIKKFGVMNSLLIALMPTASTSQIMGNIECFEPLMSNIFIRNTLAGEFIVVNKYLMNDLQKIGLWNKRIENWIKLNNGSIQSIEGIPEHIKRKYLTVWELSQKHVINLAADRTPFVDQSQSLNLHVQDLTYAKFNSMHMYAWQKGVKTGCYYLRSQEATTAQKFTVDEKLLSSKEIEYKPPEIVGPSDECLVCSS
jgi:ribonucleoside-diphosphate reductase alpha subunit